MTLPAPFPPLVAGGAGLERYPARPDALAARMSEVYGVPADHVLPVRGVTHGLELVWRLAAREGGRIEAPAARPYTDLSAIYRAGAGDAFAVVVDGAGESGALAETALRTAPGLLVVDEGLIEFADSPSAARLIGAHDNLVVLRSLSRAYGLSGARIGAVLAGPTTLARLAAMVEPHALPAPTVRLALQALDPSRLVETEARIEAVNAERARLVTAIGPIMPIQPGVGPILVARPVSIAAVLAGLTRLGVPAEVAEDRLMLPVSADPRANDRMLTALGVAPATGRAHRTATVIRDTNETRIVCAVDLDATGPIRIRTGVGFWDHMLEQVAAHGGFSLRLSCEGDLHTDPHHTVEDCAIALGQALKQALGDRRGIARYGFTVPMDEALATVAIDLSGRPYPVFEGTFATPMIGDYRTDLTAHVFRSLAEHLGAAIHVKVTGDDDHHKTEACFKALGRALRQAIRIEGEAVPSTKGVL